MTTNEFPTFAEWKEEFLHTSKNEKPIDFTNKQLLDAYINEKEGFDEAKKIREENGAKNAL